MRKNNEESSKFFTTLDAYLAGYLTLKGFEPDLIPQGNKIVFCFNASSELYKTIKDYTSGATVEAVRFSLTIKNLKSRIHSTRRENGSRKYFGQAV